jgi:hypothetical protein
MEKQKGQKDGASKYNLVERGMQRNVQEGSSRISRALGQARADGVGKFGAARCTMQIAGQHLRVLDQL